MLTRVAQYEKLSIHNIKVQAMQDVLWSSISSGRVLSGPLGLKSLMRKTIHENMMGLLICIYLVYKNQMRIFMAIKEFYKRSLGIPESLISMQIDEWIEWNFTSLVGLKLLKNWTNILDWIVFISSCPVNCIKNFFTCNETSCIILLFLNQKQMKWPRRIVGLSVSLTTPEALTQQRP